MATVTPDFSIEEFLLGERNKDLLRFSTAGSVDDGKSTLIGRLLYDTQGVYEDQLISIHKSGINRSDGPLDLALITDGLRAEREQGITIDVAYRYFSTPRRKFIIADTPGHEQYTRNMVTGASNADVAVILIDATRGVLTQSRRHTCISALLGIRNVVAAVNKMDLVDYREETFSRIAEEFRQFAAQLGVPDVHSVPVSALKGDNIARPSASMSWYEGPTLLEYLEEVPIYSTDLSRPLRFPVQYVIRPDSRFRGFAGRVASGMLRRGDQVIALPSGARSRVKSIVTFDRELDHAASGSSIAVTLEDEIDLGRGDLLAGDAGLPQTSASFTAKLVWLHADPCQAGKFYLLKHASRTLRACVRAIAHRLDVNTLDRLPSTAPQMNDIAEAHIETTLPLFFDSYASDRVMGSFILIDPATNATVAAGMIDGKAEEACAAQAGRVGLDERVRRNGHPPAALWVTERQALAENLERSIFKKGWQVQLIASDEFTAYDLNAIVTLLHRTGTIAVFSATANDAPLREAVTAIYGEQSFFAPAHSPDADAHSQAMRWLKELQTSVASGKEQQ